MIIDTLQPASLSLPTIASTDTLDSNSAIAIATATDSTTKRQLRLPTELAQQILILLPIDQHLKAIGFASKCFGQSLFTSHEFASVHMKEHLARIRKTSLLLGPVKTRQTFWNSLSFVYQCITFIEMVLARKVPTTIKISASKGMQLFKYCCEACPELKWSLQTVEFAAANGHVEVVNLWFENSCSSLSYVNGLSNGPLHLALLNEHMEIVDLFMGRYDFNPSDCGGNILALGSRVGNVGFVKRLLSDSRLTREAVEKSAKQSLDWAAEKGHIDVVLQLLEDPRVNSIPRVTDDAAHIALNNGHLNVVDCLVERSAFDPSALIEVASKSGYLSVVQTCLQDSRLSLNENNCLINASNFGHVDIVQLLLKDLRINPSWQQTPRQLTALGYACKQGRLEIVRLLLSDDRVNPTEGDNMALLEAATHGHLDVVQFLLSDTRVDPSAENNQALHAAIDSGNFQVVNELLLDPRVDPTENEDFNSALYYAACQGNAPIIKRLLQDRRVNPRDVLLNASVKWFHEVACCLIGDARLGENDLIAVEKMDACSVAYLVQVEALRTCPGLVEGSYEYRIRLREETEKRKEDISTILDQWQLS
ncbi:UNVERIFIED_CONTAM: hypothetical protein HDU68_011607 [Siphonaria sp. JEL0065]|nr:hypothetical protein HDU68_011607 [Siphonaria sp. JEL0065]